MPALTPPPSPPAEDPATRKAYADYWKEKDRTNAPDDVAESFIRHLERELAPLQKNHDDLERAVTSHPPITPITPRP